MGLFDLFLEEEKETPRVSDRELQRYERLVGNKLSQNIDRQEAIEALCRSETAASAAVLLKRFDWMLDPSITDHEEKETCLRGIIATGEPALLPVRAYCKKASSLMWPLRVLKGIVPPEALTEELLALLDEFDTEYVRNVEPKVQLISELGDHKTDEVRVAIEPFLQDASEPVRFAAVTSVFSIGSETSLPALIAALELEESRRVKVRIAQGIAERTWEVPEALLGPARGALPDGFQFTGHRVRATGT